MIQSQQCPGCGAPVDIPQGVTSFFCSYCGTSLEVPDEMVTAVEIVEDISAKSDNESELARREKIRVEIDQQQKICDQVDAITIPIFLGLCAPGFFGGFIGCSLLGANGQTGYAILCGVICGPLFIAGITLFFYFIKKKERAESKIKDLETQLGKDTRSFGEKVLDKGLGWVFGKKG